MSVSRFVSFYHHELDLCALTAVIKPEVRQEQNSAHASLMRYHVHTELHLQGSVISYRHFSTEYDVTLSKEAQDALYLAIEKLKKQTDALIKAWKSYHLREFATLAVSKPISTDKPAEASKPKK